MNHTPRTQNTVNANQRDRIRQLERKAGRDARPATSEVGVASQYGAVTVTALADTPEYDVSVGGQLVEAVVRLRTAGSSSTVVTFYLNGSSIGTVTVASSATRAAGYLGDYRVKLGDGIAAVITAVSGLVATVGALVIGLRRKDASNDALVQALEKLAENQRGEQ